MHLNVKEFIPALLIFFIITIVLSSCGKIGDPVPPETVVSPTITDRSARSPKQDDCTSYCGDGTKATDGYFLKKD